MARKTAAAKKVEEHGTPAAEQATRLRRDRLNPQEASAQEATVVQALQQAKITEQENAQAKMIGASIADVIIAETERGVHLRNAGLALVNFVTEGIVGKEGPRMSLWLHAIELEAKHKLGVDNVSKGGSLGNNMSKLRKIGKAYTLHGYVIDPATKKPVNVRGELERKLNGTGPGFGFTPAAIYAKKIEDLAREQAKSDDVLAKLMGFDPNKPVPTRGRERQEPSDVRVAAIIDDVKMLGLAKAKRVAQAALGQLLALVPMSAPKAEETRDWIASHSAELIGQIEARVKEAYAIVATPKPTDTTAAGNPLKATSADDRRKTPLTQAEKEHDIRKPTHTDEIAARRSRKAATPRKAAKTGEHTIAA